MIFDYRELFVILINLVILLTAYTFIYPYLKGNMKSIAYFDLALSWISLIFAWSIFWWSLAEFSFIFFDVNWFWFTILSYAILESLFFFRFFKGNFDVFDVNEPPVAVDIVLTLPKNVFSEALKLNKNLKEINFQNGESTPHISLSMWFVGDIYHFEELEVKLYEIANSLNKITLSLDKTRGDDIWDWLIWNSIALKESKELKDLFRKIEEEISEFYYCDWVFAFDGINDLTKKWVDGFYENKDPDNFIGHISVWIWDMEHKTYDNFTFNPSSIAVYTLWNYCTCREKVFEIELN